MYKRTISYNVKDLYHAYRENQYDDYIVSTLYAHIYNSMALICELNSHKL